MDAVDPLADVPPPRYAVESDDEDEYNPSSTGMPAGSSPPEGVKVEFKSIYDIPSGRPLVFASSEAGLGWAKIVNLGEQRAGIYVNNLPVGLLFCPSWTIAVVIVSEIETRTRLPLFSMTTYTSAIVERLQPTSVAVLDSYPIKTYISPRAIFQDSAPIRYLSIGENPVPDAKLDLFAPPNLLQSTTASLLNELFLRSVRKDLTRNAAAIILLPALPTPTGSAANSREGFGDFADPHWDREILENVHRWLFAIVGERVDESSLRARTESAATVKTKVTRSVRGEVGEGGMYI